MSAVETFVSVSKKVESTCGGNSAAFRQFPCYTLYFNLLKNTESVLQIFMHGGTTVAQIFHPNTAVSCFQLYWRRITVTKVRLFNFHAVTFIRSIPVLYSQVIFLQSLVPAGSPSRGGDVMVYVLDINQPSLPTLFILFLCLFLSLWPFQL